MKTKKTKDATIKGEQIEVNGVPVTLVCDADAEKADYLICMPDGPSDFTDNFKGACAHCGRPIMYRWHAPRTPTRICIDCGVKVAEKELGRKGVTLEARADTKHEREA
jgi:hypothetical protein